MLIVDLIISLARVVQHLPFQFCALPTLELSLRGRRDWKRALPPVVTSRHAPFTMTIQIVHYSIVGPYMASCGLVAVTKPRSMAKPSVGRKTKNRNAILNCHFYVLPHIKLCGIFFRYRREKWK